MFWIRSNRIIIVIFSAQQWSSCQPGRWSGRTRRPEERLSVQAGGWWRGWRGGEAPVQRLAGRLGSYERHGQGEAGAEEGGAQTSQGGRETPPSPLLPHAQESYQETLYRHSRMEVSFLCVWLIFYLFVIASMIFKQYKLLCSGTFHIQLQIYAQNLSRHKMISVENDSKRWSQFHSVTLSSEIMSYVRMTSLQIISQVAQNNWANVG